MPELSRRSFVELATGMLVSLPVLAGGRILAPRPAYATNDATLNSQLAGLESEYVVIDVVAPWEVGFIVVDVTKGTQKDGGLVSYPPVAGAKVTVTSRFNKNSVEGITNDNGVANIDIRQLAVHEDGQDVNDLEDYSFNGSVKVEKDGWRRFETALLVVRGGTGLEVPAHPLDTDASTPYPRLASFDEWDALYSANTFLVSPKNADDHTIAVSLVGVPSGEATVELWVDGEKSARKSAKTTAGPEILAGKHVERVFDTQIGDWVTKEVDVVVRTSGASFQAPFLKQGDAACLPVGGKFKIVVRQGNTSWSFPLAVNLATAVVDEPAGKDKQTLSLINTQKGGSTGVGATWPSGVPIIGGGDLKFWSPALPINVYVNPFGLAQITLSIPLWGYRNDKGDDQPHGWGRYPYKSVKDQWDLKKKTMQRMSDKTAALVSKPGAVQQIDLFKSVSVDFNFQLLALAQWDADKGLFQGEVAGQILAALNVTITENFFAGPIPVLITFALDASLVFGLSAATYATKKDKNEAMIDAILDFSRWHWDYENTGFTMTLNLTPSLSVGVGLRGVASISVKGAITLTLFFGVPMGTQPEGLPSPHFSAGWSALVSLVIELFLFTQSFTLYSKKFENFYDNWDGKNLTAQAEEELGALADKSLSELLSGFVPITNAMLEKTKEVSVSGSLTAQAEGEEPLVIDWNALGEEDVVELEDGTAVPVVSWDLAKVWGTEEEGDAQAESSAQAEGQDDETPLDGQAAGQAALGEDNTGKQAGAMAAAQADADMDTAELQVEPGDAAARPHAAQSEAEPLVAQEEVRDVRNAPAEVTWLTALADADLPQAGVASLGVAGGVRPSADMRLFGNDGGHVFAASHAKVVDLGRGDRTQNEGVWVFRLASVDVSGQMRTRVVANCISGNPKGTSRVIDFDTKLQGLSHADLYDYDFQVLVSRDNYGRGANASKVDTLHVAVLSGRRKSDGTASFANASTDLVFSYMLLRADDFSAAGDVAMPKSERCLSWKGTDLATNDPGSYHSINSFALWQLDDVGWSQSFAITFLDRYAPKAEDVLGEGAQVRVGVLTCIRNSVTDKFTQVTKYSEDWIKDRIGNIDSTAYEMVMYPNVNLDYNHSRLFMLRGANKAHYFWITPGYNKLGAVLHSAGRCQDYDSAIRLVECPAQGYFLASYPKDPAQLDLADDKRDYSSWSLHKITWKTTGGQHPSMYNGSEMQAELVGPSGFNIVNFAVNPQGTFLFWPHTRDADEDRVWDAKGEEDVRERPAVYQIMASRIRGSRFSDPFVVADLPTDTDALTVAATNSAAVLEALRTEYVDTGERDAKGNPVYHSANLWYTAVPAVRCATATACDAPRPFVEPGGKIDFHVAVRNDGNTFLSGCALELCVHNESTNAYERVPGASAQVTFGKDTIQESTYNRSDGNGGLSGLEPDYALAPGKTSVYAVTVTVPKDWASGDKKVLFVASDGVVAADGAIGAQAEGEQTQADLDANAVEFHVEPGEYQVIQQRTYAEQDTSQRHMDKISVEADGAGGMRFQPAPVTGGDGGQSVSADGGAGGNTSAKGSTLPRTGDNSADAGLGLAGAGLAALGAAVATYERRRSENSK